MDKDISKRVNLVVCDLKFATSIILGCRDSLDALGFNETEVKEILQTYVYNKLDEEA